MVVGLEYKLRYRWCGSPPCFKRVEEPDFRVHVAAERLGWTPGLKGEKLYTAATSVSRDASLLLLHGYDIAIEPVVTAKQWKLNHLEAFLRLDRLYRNVVAV